MGYLFFNLFVHIHDLIIKNLSGVERLLPIHLIFQNIRCAAVSAGVGTSMVAVAEVSQGRSLHLSG